YEDQNYFSRVFSRHYGMSPTAWRRENSFEA
ncbi:MAG: AraC family transcriptional regulator, partial [Planctomycetota bacterium]